jgi:UDP-N-acetylglucosamine diphosphorylase/glucosamine-1-phosphate N-acetyltransferase
MNIIFFAEKQLLPLTYTRPVCDLRVGILTISEKWCKILKINNFSHLEDGFLKPFFETVYENDNLYINANFCPVKSEIEHLVGENKNFALFSADKLVALRTTEHFFSTKDLLNFSKKVNKQFQSSTTSAIFNLWDIFLKNGKEIRSDFDLLTENRISCKIEDPHTRIYSPENIFVEEGVKIRAAIINAENAKIYIGKNASIEEGAIIRGNTGIGEGAVVNTGAKLRGDNTIGMFSKVGGEISNSVIWGYSNKGHDGFLGNSVLGAWCNLGADSNNSNLKNNYSGVRVWDIEARESRDSGETFAGLFMGDHSKCGINTMFNTGTVVGVACNIFGADFPRKYVPSFSWGKNETFELEKVFLMAENMMKRRGMVFSQREKDMINAIFSATSEERRFLTV